MSSRWRRRRRERRRCSSSSCRSGRSRSRWCRRRRMSSCCCCRRGWRRCATALQRVALTAGSRTTRSVAEVLRKGRIVLLHSRRGTGVTISHCAVDHVKACLPLVQPQLEVGSAGPREVL